MTGDERIAVSIERKVNLGNYESVGFFFSLSGLEPGTTREEMQELLETGELAFEVLREKIVEKTEAVRRADD